MRIKSILITAVSAGLVAAVSSSGSSFAKWFWFLFWTVSVCVVLMLARIGQVPDFADDADAMPLDVDPWVDQDGVRHSPNDVFDIENHPGTSDHGHI